MKKIRKILPVSTSDILGMEKWLEEQCNNGYFPVFLDAWATFTPDGIPGTRFRIEPWGERGVEPTLEERERYSNAGWKYALSVGNTWSVFYIIDPDAPEPYVDSRNRGLSLERLEQKHMRHRRIKPILVFLLGIVWAWLWLFHQSKYDVQPDSLARVPLLLITLFSPVVLMFIFSVAFLWKRVNKDLAILQQTCRALKGNMGLTFSREPSRKMMVEHMTTLVLIPVFLVLLIMQGISNYGGFSTPLEQFSQPYIPLQELEQEEITDHETLFGSSLYENGNQGEKKFSLLAPVWYEASQAGCATEEKEYQGFSPNPESDDRFELRYSPSLETACYHLLIPALARPVAESQMDRYRLINLRWSYEDISYADLDFVIIADEPQGTWQMAALGRGGKVAVFRYGGREDLRDHLDLLATLVM